MDTPIDICKEGMQIRTDTHEHARMIADFRVIHLLVRQDSLVVSLRNIQMMNMLLPPVSGVATSRSLLSSGTSSFKNVLDICGR
jgi:hypothetical protein